VSIPNHVYGTTFSTVAEPVEIDVIQQLSRQDDFSADRQEIWLVMIYTQDKTIQDCLAQQCGKKYIRGKSYVHKLPSSGLEE